jgi:hypothetical protein
MSVRTITFVRALIVSAAITLASPITLAQGAKPAIVDPGQDVQTYYREHMDEIKALQTEALDKAAPADKRIEAVEALSSKYLDFLLSIAPQLMKDENSKIAGTVFYALQSLISMEPSFGHDQHDGREDHAYQQARHDFILGLFRDNITSPHGAISEGAAAFLATRGDAGGINRIQDAVTQGRINPREAMKFLSLAPRDLVAPFFEEFAKSPNSEVQATAIAQLAYNPKYTTFVRGLVESKDATNIVLKAAMPGLAVTYKQFPEFGLTVANNAELPLDVRETALESIVKWTVKNPDSGSDILNIIAPSESIAKELSTPRSLKSLEGFKILREDR